MLRRRSGTTSLPNFNSLSQGFPADRIGVAGPRGFPCELSVVQTTRPGRPPERLQPSAFRWPFHFEGVACNGLDVQVAVDGERVDMLAATLTISPSGCRSPTGALPSSSINFPAGSVSGVLACIHFSLPKPRGPSCWRCQAWLDGLG